MNVKNDDARQEVERRLRRITGADGNPIMESPDARNVAEAIDKLVAARIAEALAGRS